MGKRPPCPIPSLLPFQWRFVKQSLVAILDDYTQKAHRNGSAKGFGQHILSLGMAALAYSGMKFADGVSCENDGNN